MICSKIFRPTALLLILAVFLLPCLPAVAEDEKHQAVEEEALAPAVDLTDKVLLNGCDATLTGGLNQMRDHNYRTFYEAILRSGLRTITVTCPEDCEPVAHMLIQWRSEPVAVAIQVQNESGEWVTVVENDDPFFAQYIELPQLKEFRIIGRDNPGEKLRISEIRLMSAGAVPDDFQMWNPQPEKVDLMLLAGHPDDEMLWFGGLLPTYAGEEGRNVLVVCAAFNTYHRRLELLDALWTTGVRIHPIFAGYRDVLTSDIMQVLKVWNRNLLYENTTMLLRKYKPDVLVLHDVKGEYGHGVHKTFCLGGMKAVELAKDATQYPQQAEQFGTWDMPKVYIHLYEENQIKMDWQRPLERFGGKTGLQVAADGFACHVSQQNRGYAVEAGGKYDNSLFGLYYTTVGPDRVGSDLFENIDQQ